MVSCTKPSPLDPTDYGFAPIENERQEDITLRTSAAASEWKCSVGGDCATE